MNTWDEWFEWRNKELNKLAILIILFGVLCICRIILLNYFNKEK